ncbi:MAG: hypothetical protein E7287_04710 [Lachnospiraceae bacterium]|nr:hypothetical protein [Lachnospiraceae bacterium]
MAELMTKENTIAKGRLLHFDLLRILACFSVVMLHSAAQFWYVVPVTDPEWFVINAYDAVVRFGVPVFVMISGALFLNAEKEISFKRLFLHNILRMIILYLVWSLIYGLFDCRLYQTQIGFDVVLQELIVGRYHLWFLRMIAGIYLLLPIIKTWLINASKKHVEYFLILFMIFQVGRETLHAVIKWNWMNFLSNSVEIDMVCGYLGYFVLGYYIVHYGIDKKWHKWIYAGGILSVPANILGSYVLSVRANMAVGELFDSFGIFTFMISLALFLFFTEKVSKVHYAEGATRIIRELSSATLGIYLMHLLFIEFFGTYGFHSRMIPSIVGIPVLAVACFAVCFVISAIVRRIPLVGKYLC